MAKWFAKKQARKQGLAFMSTDSHMKLIILACKSRKHTLKLKRMTIGRDFRVLQFIECVTQQSSSFRAVANLTPGTCLQSAKILECRQKVIRIRIRMIYFSS